MGKQLTQEKKACKIINDGTCESVRLWQRRYMSQLSGQLNHSNCASQVPDEMHTKGQSQQVKPKVIKLPYAPLYPISRMRKTLCRTGHLKKGTKQTGLKLYN